MTDYPLVPGYQQSSSRDALKQHVLTLKHRIPSWSAERVLPFLQATTMKFLPDRITENSLVCVPNYSNLHQVPVAAAAAVSMYPSLAMHV
jgi:hypothetical protein